MLKPLPLLGQLVVYGLIALVLGIFAQFPSYRPPNASKAQLTISFSHIGAHKEACEKLTREQMAEMAANMRRAELCPRERSPIFVELLLDDRPLLAQEVPPTGLAGDGAAQVYRKFSVEPGRHQLAAGLRENLTVDDFDYSRTAEIDLAPGQSLVLDFRTERGGFYFPGQE